MGNNESIPTPQTDGKMAALVERGKRTTNIGEKITIAFELIRELKTIPPSLLKKTVRDKFAKMNKDMYSFLHSIKDYVADYEFEYQILAQLQKEWSPEECKEKTRNHLMKERKGKPSLLARIVASTNEFQKKLRELLIDIMEIKDLCETCHISVKNWALIVAGTAAIIGGIIAAISMPVLMPVGVVFVVAGSFSIVNGMVGARDDLKKRQAIQEFQKELEESVAFLQGTLVELDPLIIDHDKAIKVLNGLEEHEEDFQIENAAEMCETFNLLHAAFRTAVGEKATVSTADPPIPLGYVLTGAAAVGLVAIAQNSYVPVAQQ